MKYIQKGKEPSTLKKYRETTPNAVYDKGYVDSGQVLKKTLLKEQGYICAYCMKRISLKRTNNKPSIEVEHFLSQYEIKYHYRQLQRPLLPRTSPPIRRTSDQKPSYRSIRRR